MTYCIFFQFDSIICIFFLISAAISTAFLLPPDRENCSFMYLEANDCQSKTRTVHKVSSVQRKGNLNPAANGAPTHQHKHLASVPSPHPLFMWNGSLPADKSIGSTLSTPTCENKRLYRQPTDWKQCCPPARSRAPHQLKMKGEVTKTQTGDVSADCAHQNLYLVRQTLPGDL